MQHLHLGWVGGLGLVEQGDAAAGKRANVALEGELREGELQKEVGDGVRLLLIQPGVTEVVVHKQAAVQVSWGRAEPVPFGAEGEADACDVGQPPRGYPRVSSRSRTG